MTGKSTLSSVIFPADNETSPRLPLHFFELSLMSVMIVFPAEASANVFDNIDFSREPRSGSNTYESIIELDDFLQLFAGSGLKRKVSLKSDNR